MRPTGSGPRRSLLATASVTLAMALLALPALSVTTGGLEVALSTSEDNVVMNSDVDLTVTVRDAITGEPATGCDVLLHIEAAQAKGDGADGHGHGPPIEVPDGVPTPSLDITVKPDQKAGWNLRVRTENFDFAPQNASLAHAWGEGHAHLYIDGEKLGRLYGEWYHISGLAAGTHEVRVTLNANDHSDLAKDGEVIEDAETLVSAGPGPHHHMASTYEVPDGVPVPRVDLTVTPDPKKGWNVHVQTTDFRWAPENASTPPVMGEGHAHLYVGDHKVGRLYDGWFYLSGLSEGTHEVRVTLNASNHSDYAREGVVIEDSETLVVPPGEGDGAPGHGSTGLSASEVGPGRYRIRHNFADAGEYLVEVHVSGEGRDEVAATFQVEVLEGDPALVTIAGVVFYVVLAVVLIMAGQFLLMRRRVRRLRSLEGPADDDAKEPP